jgi:LCP family protein required for cell wall assembly
MLMLFCMLGASVGAYALIKYGSIDRVAGLDGLPSVAEGEPENFLIVALDTREGEESRNTDTIMVLRVDPASDRVSLTSFPRDLMVTIADTGELGMINSAYDRESEGARVLVETLEQNFGITINHYVEVGFDSFRQVVDAVGGVPVWMERAARDRHSGFYNEQLGCVTLDGESALDFVRSRYLDVMTEDGWERDTKSDEHRVLRQQIFLQRALSLALADARSSPRRMQELIDIGVGNIALDPNLGVGDLFDLADRFKDFDADELETYPLPVLHYPEDDNRRVLDELPAEPMLNVFRGLPPGEIRPQLIEVTVLNGTTADPARERADLAGEVSAALANVGFEVAAPLDAPDFHDRTVILHAPDEEVYAQRVARSISGGAAVAIEADPDLAPGQVRLIAGLDFTGVQDEPTPLADMPGAPATAAPGSTGSGGDQSTTTPGASGKPEATDNPFIIGATPEGVDC